MAKRPNAFQRLPVVAPTPPAVSPVAAVTPNDQQEAARSDAIAPPAPIISEIPAKRWLKMETSLAGPRFSVSPGQKHPFSDTPAADGGPSEAQRLVDAGFAVDCDPPAEA
ncbi:hypothetical protein [Sphingomonas bisphenolicum]|uniref:Uncharacterized protein n=1 Tax=Sphingomonas bisphenolicum TaxID=296544 RepID=A0ABM7FYH4_9SPHN|nr:hypothetical protein [Sphingomonas bisphenolicum]BBF70195.1 hypothetical protein SBA_ch1_23950 [Sphingomonas bisphenolicum]